LADLKAERAALATKVRQTETEAAPIRYVAEPIGTGADTQRAIRLLIALTVLCCDPLAIALTLRRRHRGDSQRGTESMLLRKRLEQRSSIGRDVHRAQRPIA
jgi:hypothetical protein